MSLFTTSHGDAKREFAFHFYNVVVGDTLKHYLCRAHDCVHLHRIGGFCAVKRKFFFNGNSKIIRLDFSVLRERNSCKNRRFYGRAVVGRKCLFRYTNGAETENGIYLRSNVFVVVKRHGHGF